ncbi:transglycosylase SLT domain-containing protein [Aureibaculum sp. 2210JD6-5]|uniref:lytic transglycosylase domain-containing protein n=1 Tax=Aureibaculum sp. 2210JD6-5 TaxID=3103957 RepID=UPI002AAD69D9|nr:transglycosylase SLT domain-containing protein [Aureibaculum sp. 2210JD6-5]MDY7396468.1 transglycosylase SLT domain-containing protein [Aureibaculum sp. 2210JD6-5]
MKKLFSTTLIFYAVLLFAQDISITDFDYQATNTESPISNVFEGDLPQVGKSKPIENERFSSMVLKDRLAALNNKTPFDVPYNATVERFIRLYLRDNKTAISNLMDRANYYFPIFEQYLDKYDLPLEIKYLAVVESALLPTAKSHAGAKGIWQFMYHTGKEYGLNVTSYVDERNDPLRATEAACNYLKDLYERFGDWDLALAAYNSGPGNVNKAIRRSGGKRNYWNIRQYLPSETSSYVPAFYAMFYLFEYGEAHRIYPNTIEIDYFDTDTLHINEKLSFNQVEKRTGIPYKFIASLNPQYKLGIIPYQKNKNYVLALPKNAIDKFLSSSPTTESNMKSKELPKHIIPTAKNSYVVQALDNLPKISKKFGISLQQLKAWNGLQTDFLIEGQRLVITDKDAEKHIAVKINPVKTNNTTAKPQTFKNYTVKKGDSLFIISKKFPNVSISQLRNWNNIWGVSYVEPGTKLKILTTAE